MAINQPTGMSVPCWHGKAGWDLDSVKNRQLFSTEEMFECSECKNNWKGCGGGNIIICARNYSKLNSTRSFNSYSQVFPSHSNKLCKSFEPLSCQFISNCAESSMNWSSFSRIWLTCDPNYETVLILWKSPQVLERKIRFNTKLVYVTQGGSRKIKTWSLHRFEYEKL